MIAYIKIIYELFMPPDPPNTLDEFFDKKNTHQFESDYELAIHLIEECDHRFNPYCIRENKGNYAIYLGDKFIYQHEDIKMTFEVIMALKLIDSKE